MSKLDEKPADVGSAAEVLDSLGPEAEAAFRGEAPAFDRRPETIEGAAERAALREGPGGAVWHRVWRVEGFRVREGLAESVVWEVDSEGAWAEGESKSLADADAADWRARQFDEDPAGWREYYGHVARTGDDPLHVFRPAATRMRLFDARVTRGAKGDYPVWSGWRKGRGGWREPEEAPAGLAEHLNVTERPGAERRLCEYGTLAELLAETPTARKRRDGSVIVGRISVAETVSEKSLKKQRQKEARARLNGSVPGLS